MHAEPDQDVEALERAEVEAVIATLTDADLDVEEDVPMPGTYAG